MNKYPVSVIICVLNEEKRIKETIESARRNNPFEIIVVEGGSTDNTSSVASLYADKVFSVNEVGLGYKRAMGVKIATQKYILNLDADQILEDNALKIMIKELEQNNFAGIQANLKSVSNNTYFEKAMEFNVSQVHIHTKHSSLNNNYPINATMIGTPALFKTEILKKHNFNEAITGSCDDTDLCYRLTKLGYNLGISSMVCYQKHRGDFLTTYKKFSWYGEGDCEFAILHPERFLSIFFHPLKNYVFKKSFISIIKGQPKYVPYFVLTGLIRHFSFYKYLIKRIMGTTKDSRSSNLDDYNY
jgi:glycosyltransferase involved in cell wall biosynthesis